jgi:hypothetical protein
MIDMTCEGKGLPLDVSVSQIVNREWLYTGLKKDKIPLRDLESKERQLPMEQ